MVQLCLWVNVKRTAAVSFLLSFILHVGSTFTVKREATPYFLKTPTNITVHEGELAVLKCHIAKLGPKMVVWRKLPDDFPLTIGEMTFSEADDMTISHAKLSRSSSTWDLMIKDVKPQHAGVYECQVSANHLIAQYVSLNVIERSSLTPDLQMKGTKFVNMGQQIHLLCNASGINRAPEKIDWFFKGSRIHPSNPRWKGRVEILKHTSIPGRYFISELFIEQSTIADQGDYVCRSSDLIVNNLKVHVLNADTDNKTRRDSDKDKQVKEEIVRPSSTASDMFKTRDIIRQQYVILTMVIITIVLR